MNKSWRTALIATLILILCCGVVSLLKIAFSKKVMPTDDNSEFVNITDVVPDASMKGHIDRSFPLSETGSKLRGIHLENIALSVSAAGGGLIAEE